MRRPSKGSLSTCFAVGAWISLSLAVAVPEFDWAARKPSHTLEYHPCYDGFQCARLLVPRDWLDASNNKTVALAVIALPATVSPDDPSFGGTIITNPGGPGGSGVNFLRGRSGKLLQQMTEGKKHYEILSFDPRGIENTTPNVDCFGKSHLLSRDSLLLEWRGIGGLDASESGLRRALALFDGLGGLCEATDLDDDILSYVSTASVARDIVEIADRVEEHRQAQLSLPRRDASQRPLDSGPHRRGKPSRVLYWGFSYGTVLGNTLASMFPGRMGRVILDGVVDIHDYMGATWLRNLLDTEKIIDYFYDTCVDAADSCPLWMKGDKSGHDIKSRVDQLISDRDKSPVALVPSDGTSNIRVITGFDVRSAFIVPVYKPLPTAFSQLALTLAEALKGNYSLIQNDLGLPQLEDACGIKNRTASSPGDAQTAILCGDAQYQSSKASTGRESKHDVSYWRRYIAELKDESSTLGPYWSRIATSCSGWRVTPKWVFTGPWTTPPADPSLEENAPAAPILL